MSSFIFDSFVVVSFVILALLVKVAADGSCSKKEVGTQG